MESFNPSELTILQSIGKLWRYLSNRRKCQVGILGIFMILSGGAEIISLATLVPFLGVLADADSIWQNPTTQRFINIFGILGMDINTFILIITLVFCTSVILAAAIRIFTLWGTFQVSAYIGSDLSSSIYERNLYQPYTTHLNVNSSEMIAVTTIDVPRVYNGFVYHLLTTISALFIVISIISTLLVIQPIITIALGIIISIVYSTTLYLNRKPLRIIGFKRTMLGVKITKSVQEGLGSIRDVILDGSQAFYTELYRRSASELRKAEAQGQFLSIYPRFLLEPFGIILIALMGFFLVSKGEFSKAIPVLGLLALGSQRLLPPAQKIYESYAILIQAKPSLDKVLYYLTQKLPDLKYYKNIEPLRLNNSIDMKSVHFRYNKNQEEIINGLNLKLYKGERIGFIGKTGSGKSTTIDLLMGLLEPSSGTICVDGENINEEKNPQKLLSWRASIAHVPQTIYLSDATIAENIAFGIEKEDINIKNVRRAAAKAQIGSYIESLKDGYETFVGERGIRLSGGQRQRIGIARALYKNAQVLVFDEATSSLDNDTEKAVIDALDQLDDELTVLMIAHRLTTLERCDRIIHLENGLVLRDGVPKEVLNSE